MMDKLYRILIKILKVVLFILTAVVIVAFPKLIFGILGIGIIALIVWCISIFV